MKTLQTKTETTLPVEIQEIAKGVSVEKRNEVQNVLNSVFDGVSKMREQLDSVVVEDENDKVNMKLANTIRLGVKNKRLDAEKTFDAKRTEVQQAMLSFKTEDSLWLKAKQTMQILTKEIEENAKWKEDTALRFEIEQKELETQRRENLINKFNLEITRNEFENMSDETFKTFISGIEKAFNDKLEAEKQAELKRVAEEKAEAERLESQRLENIRLKKEAEEKEKALEKERAEAKAKQDAIELIAKKEREELVKAQAIKDAKIKAENDAKLKAEKEAREKIEAELKAKQEAESKSEQERIAKELKVKQDAEKLNKAPVKEQLTAWVNLFEIPIPKTPNETSVEITKKFNAFVKWAKSEIDNL